MGLFGLTFLNTALLVGGLALFVPYLVHLLTRSTPRRIVFPTLQFLQKAQASQSRLFRLRHILLMLLRTAFILLLLIAFLRPVHHDRVSAAADDPYARHAHILVLDTSASMGYSRAGFTPFAKAQGVAGEIVDRIGARDAGNLILAGRMPRSSFPEPSSNRFHLRRDLQTAEVASERAEIDAAIVEAVKQLQALDGYTGHIHFISDFQRTNWAAVNFGAIPESIQVTFWGCGDPESVNAGITGVTVRPSSPTQGEAVELTCEITNYGERGGAATVSVEVADETTLTREVSLRPNSSATASFRIRAHEPGSFECTVSIGEDGLTVDDRRFLVLNVAERIRVLMISDSDTSGNEASARYVVRALSPAEQRSGTPEVRVVRSVDAESAIGPGTPVVVMDGAGALSEGAAEKLLAYVHQGGALIHFLNGPAEAANQTQFAEATGNEWAAPFAIGARRDHEFARTGTYARLAQANFDDPLLRKFRDTDDLRKVEFYRYFTTTRSAGAGQVLLRYDDENVAMARMAYGQGVVLLCNFSAGLADSNFAKRTVFLPLLQEMVKSCRTDAGAPSFVVGQPASLATVLPSEGGLRFTNPAGESITASVERGTDEGSILFAQTPAVGFYRAFAGDNRLASVAVNVDARESDLGLLTAEQMEQLSAGSRTAMAPGSADAESVSQLFDGRPLWHYFLAGALALFMVEQALQWWWRQ